jgi:elongation factor P hydroxylase
MNVSKAVVALSIAFALGYVAAAQGEGAHWAYGGHGDRPSGEH